MTAEAFTSLLDICCLFPYPRPSRHPCMEYHKHLWPETELPSAPWRLPGLCAGADDLLGCFVLLEPDFFIHAEPAACHRRHLHSVACGSYLPQWTQERIKYESPALLKGLLL